MALKFSVVLAMALRFGVTLLLDLALSWLVLCYYFHLGALWLVSAVLPDFTALRVSGVLQLCCAPTVALLAQLTRV